MFTRDVRLAADLRRHYVTGYDDKRQIDGQRVNATVNHQLLRKFEVNLFGKSVLDVGSGYGCFLSDARKAGAQRAVGVELSDAERKYSTHQHNLEVYSNIRDIKEDTQFDIITMFEVIEHIAEPGEFTQMTTKYLKTGGSLIIGTDNFESRVVSVLGDRFPKWIPHEHISLFTPESLCAMIDRLAGLKIVGLSSFTPWELLAREILFKATNGTLGGKQFSLQAEEAQGGDRHYRYFVLRRLVNSAWFALTNQPNADGAMMFVHAIKA